jgi:hypothetical protein
MSKRTKKFMEDAEDIFGDEYDYSLVEYKTAFTMIIIVCRIHGEFKMTPNRHLAGFGCPKCRNNS